MPHAIHGRLQALVPDGTGDARRLSVVVAHAWCPRGTPIQRLREPTFWVGDDGTMQFSTDAVRDLVRGLSPGMSVRVEFETDLLGLARAVHVESLEGP